MQKNGPCEFLLFCMMFCFNMYVCTLYCYSDSGWIQAQHTNTGGKPGFRKFIMGLAGTEGWRGELWCLAKVEVGGWGEQAGVTRVLVGIQAATGAVTMFWGCLGEELGWIYGRRWKADGKQVEQGIRKGREGTAQTDRRQGNCGYDVYSLLLNSPVYMHNFHLYQYFYTVVLLLLLTGIVEYFWSGVVWGS